MFDALWENIKKGMVHFVSERIIKFWFPITLQVNNGGDVKGIANHLKSFLFTYILHHPIVSNNY